MTVGEGGDGIAGAVLLLPATCRAAEVVSVRSGCAGDAPVASSRA